MRYVVTGGRKIAIVSATEIERFYHFTQKAQKEKPGVLKTQQEEVWKKELKRAKKNSDYVIAYVHWGTEGKIHYGQDQTEIADLCVKAGADAVIGGHPHRLQGVEFIKMCRWHTAWEISGFLPENFTQRLHRFRLMIPAV